MAGKTLIFLLDTGASISLVKFNKILFNTPINNNIISHISGIKEGFIQTIGLTTSDIEIGNFSLNHNFHVVNDNFPIPADGIIGLDFIHKYKCKLDYFKWELTIRKNTFHDKLRIPIYDQPSTNSSDYFNTFAIPARCEVVRRITLTNEEVDKVVPNQLIQPGV